MSNDIVALILTMNEEIHLERCINSIKNLVTKIYIIDSGSKDKTREIASKYDASFFHNKFYNYSTQFNWGLNIVRNGNHKWILRIDADEILTPKLNKEIKKTINNIEDNVAGIAFPRKIIFNNKTLNFGGITSIQLRLFKSNLGHCENTFMDEHIRVKGKVKVLREPFFDHNLKNLSWWIQKHNLYSNREVIDSLNLYKKKVYLDKGSLSKNNQIKRFIKKSIYKKFPLFLRGFLYFLFRYFLLLGFLDGQAGLIYIFFQTFWYRFLVDSKQVELKNFCKNNNLTLNEGVKRIFIDNNIYNN